MATVKREKSDAFAALNAHITEIDGAQTKAGWFESSRYEKGTSVAYVASIHEFGASSRNIPPRPFMRPTVEREKGAWLSLLASGAKAILAGNTTSRSVMEALGAKAAGEIARSITMVTSPPLKLATVAARARRTASGEITPTLMKPLVDTGLMLSSVTYVVEDTK